MPNNHSVTVYNANINLQCFLSNNKIYFFTEAWFVGCFPDTGLLKNFQTVSVPGDTIGSGTNFTKQNAVKCAVKCSVANANHKYAVFSQTGICLCSNSVYNISGSVSSALCTQKTCQLLADESSCDGRTYHWLVNASKMITAVKIVSTNILQGSVPQKITVTTVPGSLPIFIRSEAINQT